MKAMSDASAFVNGRAVAWLAAYTVDRLIARDVDVLDGLVADLEDEQRAVEAKLANWGLEQHRQLGMTSTRAVLHLDLMAQAHAVKTMLKVIKDKRSQGGQHGNGE